MKTFLTLALLPLLGGPANQLTEAGRLQADGKPIDIRVGHLVPAVADWDGDGKRDLLVGQFLGGKIVLYRNQGTDKTPKFGAGENLKAGDKEISLPCG